MKNKDKDYDKDRNEILDENIDEEKVKGSSLAGRKPLKGDRGDEVCFCLFIHVHMAIYSIDDVDNGLRKEDVVLVCIFIYIYHSLGGSLAGGELLKRR